MQALGECIAQASIGVAEQLVVRLLADALARQGRRVEIYRLEHDLVVVGDIEIRVDPAHHGAAAGGLGFRQSLIAG
ncbi:hypothetical protein D3C80_1903800 [compost metagenome]